MLFMIIEIEWFFIIKFFVKWENNEGGNFVKGKGVYVFMYCIRVSEGGKDMSWEYFFVEIL